MKNAFIVGIIIITPVITIIIIIIIVIIIIIIEITSYYFNLIPESFSFLLYVI